MARAEDTQLIDSFKEFYSDYYRSEIAELAQQYPKEQKSLVIDWGDLYTFDADIADDLRQKPRQLLQYAEEALRLYDLPVNVSLGQAHVRVTGLPETTDISEIRADQRGNLLTIRGSVRRISDVRPKITTAAFECQRCGTLTRIPQDRTAGDSNFQEPHECQGCERQGPFQINYDQSEFIDSQKLEVQNSVGGLQDTDPERISVIIEDDETGKTSLGDRLRITGILKLEQLGSNSNPSAHFDSYLKGLTVEPDGRDFSHIEITDTEKEEIDEFSNQQDLYDKMVDSIAPTIYDYETEKLALVLQLFGGVPKEQPDGTYIRGNIHTLVVSDVDSMVDRLLECVANCSPRAVKASGSETSGTGLTTTAYTSSSSGGDSPWTIGAGPLIEADNGHALITNAEDLGTEAESSLETVLREQFVDASKATESVSLSANTSVFLGSSPDTGRFDRYQPLIEQIGLSPNVATSLDLVFPIADKPEEGSVEASANHRLQSNYAGELDTHLTKKDSSNYTQNQVEEASKDIIPPVEPELLRKYVAYARRNCFPVLTAEARTMIEDCYTELRLEGSSEEAPVPISKQDLETLVRLSEASARVRLSDSVEEDDAKRAIKIFQHYVQQMGLTPKTNELERDILEAEERNGLDDQKECILNIVSDIESNHDKGAPQEVVLERAEKEGMEASTAHHTIERLKVLGEVYEPAENHLRTT